MTLPVVFDPGAVTPQWLTLALAKGGITCRVTGFEASAIGNGMLGEIVRFVLEGDGVPDSVIGKFPSRDPVSRLSSEQLQIYVREVFFYTTLSKTVDVQTPRVHFADCNDTGNEFVILMEDLAPGAPGDPLVGCDIDQAALALEQLARLQGPRWGDESLRQYPLLGHRTGRGNAPSDATHRFVKAQARFLDRYAGRLTDDCIARVPALGETMGAYESWYTGPLGLVHADYRVDNMLFGGPYPLAVIDWQTLSLDCPMRDASYFLGTCMRTQDRRREERQLLNHYLEVLRSYAVDLSWDDCFACYRHHAPAGLIMAVMATMIVGDTDHSDELFATMARRSNRMTRDLA